MPIMGTGPGRDQPSIDAHRLLGENGTLRIATGAKRRHMLRTAQQLSGKPRTIPRDPPPGQQPVQRRAYPNTNHPHLPRYDATRPRRPSTQTPPPQATHPGTFMTRFHHMVLDRRSSAPAPLTAAKEPPRPAYCGSRCISPTSQSNRWCGVPPHTVTSGELEDRLGEVTARLELPANPIQPLTGIAERRFWDEGLPVHQVAARVARQAIAAAGIEPEQVGLLINTSICKDFLEPSMASLIHGDVGLGPECTNFRPRQRLPGIHERHRGGGPDDRRRARRLRAPGGRRERPATSWSPRSGAFRTRLTARNAGNTGGGPCAA